MTAVHHDKEAIRALLDRYFPSLDNTARDIISGTSSLQVLNEGGTVTRTGGNLKHVVLVAGGSMKVYRENPGEGEALLYYLEPGDACAFSLICASRRETSGVMIRAMEESTVILLPVTVMEQLMKDHKSWYQFVIATYRARFEDLLSAFDSVVFKKLDERLIEYLYAQAAQRRSNILPVTHQEIADDLHSTREVISRLLKKMEQEGLITINRNSLVINEKKHSF